MKRLRWEDKLAVLRWRAVEEADREAAVLDLETRKSASKAALDLPGPFLAARAQWLTLHSTEGVRAMVETLRIPSVPAWPGWAIAVAALVLGYVLTELGEHGRVNLLALPLIGILIWNAVVMLLSLLAELTSACKPPVWLGAWLKWGDRGSLKVFQDRVLPLVATRAGVQARGWFHFGAAALALGSIAGLYAKGWSTEYRAVWESTILGAEDAARFLRVLFTPASAVFKLPIPVAEITEMRTGPGREAAAGAPALPWIHLYAGTLLLLVIVPRLVLVMINCVRGSICVERLWRSLDWESYERRLRRSASTVSEHAWMVTHGWRTADEQRDRWSVAVEEALGVQVQTEYLSVPPGGEDEFVETWTHTDGTLVIVFNAAATPEAEVQGQLAGDLRTRFGSGRVLALVDARPLRERRGDSIGSRIQLWQEMLKNSVDEVVIIED